MSKKIYVNVAEEELIGTFVTRFAVEEDNAIVIKGLQNHNGEIVECEYMVHNNTFFERVE